MSFFTFIVVVVALLVAPFAWVVLQMVWAILFVRTPDVPKVIVKSDAWHKKAEDFAYKCVAATDKSFGVTPPKREDYKLSH